MINRENWKLVRAYLDYRRDVDLLGSASLRLEKTWLSHVLLWADYRYFDVVPKIRPTFPQLLQYHEFSSNYISHVVRSARRFFVWLSKHRRGFSSITAAWLDTLKVPSVGSSDKVHEIVTLDEIRAIAFAPAETIRDRRIRASAVFWWLSGIRVGAFVTLPVSAVDMQGLTIKQFPSLGVKTKFNKKAVTFLLDVPDLLSVVRAWDREVRVAGSRFWFASISPETGLIDPSVSEVGQHRNIRARKDLADWLSHVGLPYHSPHKFRHGHAVYAIKNARTISSLKAVSQNLMHSSLKITDGVYGILSDLDVQSEIHSLGKTVDDDLYQKLRDLLK
jgi:integrase